MSIRQLQTTSNYELLSNDKHTILLKDKRITTCNQLTEYSKQLLYKRNANRTDVSEILNEKKTLAVLNTHS
ncbi:hypothetical protein KO504_00325 [Winogradskyella psychrotolerans]|uniref:hypothetical protein n=1 Tax=Winogradskyella psychrotolerans TaxID=1344585 RepID=UPI001C07690A|nr:hypothetical protein [Winogradskyella psychrotolerans]MBU2919771.1 hypothetical protein [Winogradskyella psychrotolerans]